MDSSNVVHSYYNNQPIRRLLEDLINEDQVTSCQVVEVTRVGHTKPQLAILTPFYAEKRTADVVKLVEAAPVEPEKPKEGAEGLVTK